jgi:hypothetical protein
MHPTELNQPSNLEIEAAADILANFHDLPIADIESEFRSIMSESFPGIDGELLRHVYEQFMAINPMTRFSREFDHVQFVSDSYRCFRK